MSPISFTQQGIVTQYELAKILIITSDGVLEVYLPLTDDDRRDMEIHVRGKFVRSIALQDPVFIVPSEEVHKHAAPHLDGDRWTFNFGASLDPDSQDRWVPFRVKAHEVGQRV